MQTYLSQAQSIIQQLKLEKFTDFNKARRKVFNSTELQQLMRNNQIPNSVAISAGTSSLLAFPLYLEQIADDLSRNLYYRDYAPTEGNLMAREALAFLENIQLNKSKYTAANICLTEGSTGAISSVLEVFQKFFGNGEVLIINPAYYIYKLAAKYFRLPYKEVLPLKQNDKTISFKKVKDILDGITPRTKLIVLCNPTNPSGEIYSAAEATQILRAAQKQNAIVLVDELFNELVFQPENYVSFGQIADQIGALDNLITVKGYSKTKNLAALRIGYLLSKNQEWLEKISLVSEERQCFPASSAFSGLICLDSFIQSALAISNKSTKRLSETVSELKNDFYFAPLIQEKTIKELLTDCRLYKQFRSKNLTYYLDLYQAALRTVQKITTAQTPTKSAFNTFIKIENLRKVNQFDFTLNLYLITGVKIEIGPCFGFSQQEWETNPDLGFWLRLSFSQKKTQYISSLKRLLKFIPFYLENKEKLLQTDLSF